MVAYMGLLAGVGPPVNGQSAALNEALFAIFHCAEEGPLIDVYPMMATEV